MITNNNILSHELIGLHARVIQSTNLQLVGLNGLVINETKSMLQMDTNTGRKSIPKENNVWEFSTSNDKFVVSGTKITKRPFDRIGGKL